jgi:hypothetical protein
MLKKLIRIFNNLRYRVLRQTKIFSTYPSLNLDLHNITNGSTNKISMTVQIENKVGFNNNLVKVM